MIDWLAVLINSSWILGLAIVLASFSYHYWYAPLNKRTLREPLRQPRFLRCFWLGLILLALGLAGTSRRLWEAGMWSLFLLISTINAIKIQRSSS
jgi:hypothetical protein